jgi:hypothetical protein
MNVRRDFKSRAAGERDDDFDFPAVEQKADEEIEPGPQRDRCVAGQDQRPTQITAHVALKVLKLAPSNKDWLSVMKEILCGRLGIRS